MCWNLEWYYFGDLVTMVEGGDCLTSRTINKRELVDDMLGKCTNNKNKLLKILRGEKTNIGELELFAQFRVLQSIKRREQDGGKYRWKQWNKGSEMDLIISPILGLKPQILVEPGKIILPWPFPISGGDTLAQCVPEFKPKSLGYDVDLHFQIGPCMRFIDDLLMNDDSQIGKEYRKKFIESTEPSDSREILLDYTKEKQGQEIKLPACVHVIVKELIHPNATFIENFGSEIYLNVGVRDVTVDLDKKPASFDKWPCGAFERNEKLSGNFRKQ